MELRKVKFEELEEFLALAKEFNDLVGLTEFSKEGTASLLHLSTQPSSDVLALGLYRSGKLEGGLSAVCITPAFATTKIVAELGWFVRKESRSYFTARRMILWLENWAKQKGATYVSMVAQKNTGVLVQPLYKKLGYELSEETFIKVL